MSETDSVVPEAYAGREQAYIKHLFLKRYMETLVHKIASFADKIVYVDGFSGPWKSATEDYADTSFGIALKALTEARKSWLHMVHRPRNVMMQASLVEQDAGAYAQLQQIGSHFPDVTVTPYNDDFMTVAPTIAAAVPPGAFAFVLVDPKGFKLDLMKLKPLISRDRCEVVFNFMFDYANRFPTLPQLKMTFDRLFPGVDWQSRITALENDPNATPEQRKRLFLDCFKEAVRNVGGYKYIADVDIQYPGRDRTFYFLVYGTRKAAGIKVFRDCQIKALEEQSAVGSRIRSDAAETTGQRELPGMMAAVRSAQFKANLDREAIAARRLLLDSIPVQGGIKWGELWPAVLSEHVIRENELGRIVNDLRKGGILSVPSWKGPQKRKPEDDYLIFRGPAFESRV